MEGIQLEPHPCRMDEAPLVTPKLPNLQKPRRPTHLSFRVIEAISETPNICSFFLFLFFPIPSPLPLLSGNHKPCSSRPSAYAATRTRHLRAVWVCVLGPTNPSWGLKNSPVLAQQRFRGAPLSAWFEGNQRKVPKCTKPYCDAYLLALVSESRPMDLFSHGSLSFRGASPLKSRLPCQREWV